MDTSGTAVELSASAESSMISPPPPKSTNLRRQHSRRLAAFDLTTTGAVQPLRRRWASVGRRIRDVPNPARVDPLSSAPGKDRGIAPEAPDRAVDPEEQLPGKLWDGHDRLQRMQRATRMVAGEHHGRPGQDD